MVWHISTDLFQQFAGSVALEEAGLNKALTGAHQVVGEEAWVNAILSPPTNAVGHSDHVSVSSYLGQTCVLSNWLGGFLSFPRAPLIDVPCNEVGIVPDLTLEDVVDVVPIVAGLREPTHRGDCKHCNEDSAWKTERLFDLMLLKNLFYRFISIFFFLKRLISTTSVAQFMTCYMSNIFEHPDDFRTAVNCGATIAQYKSQQLK